MLGPLGLAGGIHAQTPGLIVRPPLSPPAEITLAGLSLLGTPSYPATLGVPTSAGTSISQGTGITCTPNPITGTGTVAVASTIPQAETLKVTDSATTSGPAVLTLEHDSTGTPGVGFAEFIQFNLMDSTTAGEPAGQIVVLWNNATHGTQAADMYFVASDNAGNREFFRGRSSSGAANISFFGGGPAAKQSGDVATAMTAYSLMSSPVYNSSSLSGAISNTLLPLFQAAGASHAKGIVPDPGATSHSHYPYYFGDDAGFHPNLGGLLAYSMVATDQSTTSTTPVNLTTVDTITYTTDVTSTVLLLFISEGYNNTTAGANGVGVYTGTGGGGGTLQDGIAFTEVSANYGFIINLPIVLSSQAAGTYSYQVEYNTSTSCTAHFLKRFFAAYRIA